VTWTYWRLEAKKRSLLALNRIEESIKVSEKIVHLDPKNAEAYVDLGIAYHRMGSHKKALSSYRKALAIEPNDIRTWELKKLTIIALDDPAEIISTCDEILALDPGNRSALLDKVSELERTGQLGPAVEALQKAIRIDPEDKGTLVRLGVLLTAMGRYKEALEVFDEAWRIDDTDMSILDNKGRALLFLRRYEEALQAFDRCVSSNPSNARFHMDRGRALASLDRLEQAIEAFDHATSLDRSYAEAWKFKGSAQLKLGDNNKAVQSFNRAIDLGVEDGTVLRMKGRALENMGRLGEAREAYSRASVVSPSDQIVWERIALIDESEGMLENAFSAIDRASALDTGVKRVWMERAAIAEKLGKDEEVLKSYDGALALDPNDAIAWNGKGLALLRQGSHANSMRALQRALELDPAMQSAQEGIDQAERELHKVEVAEHATRVLDMESRQGRRLNKEETFRSCAVPYELLDEVTAYIERKEVLDVTSLSEEDLEMYEDASRTVLLNAYRNPSVTAYGLKLADVRASLPGYDLSTSKMVYTYIETVNALDLSRDMPDPGIQSLMRRAVDLPEDRRSVIALMETLDIGIYRARRLKVAMNALRSVGAAEAPAPKAKKKSVRPKLRRSPTPARPQYGPEPMTVAAPLMEEPDIEPIEMQGPDAVFLPPAEPAEAGPVHRQGTTRDPLLYTNNERELYSTFYGPDKKPRGETGIHSRRCLFHGESAQSSCPECGSLLCRQCVTSGTCPRCGVQVRVKPLTAPARKKDKARPEPEPDEIELERIEPGEAPAYAPERHGAVRASEDTEEGEERDVSRL